METTATRTVEQDSGSFAASDQAVAATPSIHPLRTLFIALFGEPGRVIIWTACMAGLFALSPVINHALIMFVSLTVLIRLGFVLSQSRNSLLNRYGVERRFTVVMRDELLYSIVAAAGAYLAGLDLPRITFLLILAANLVGQLTMLGLARLSLQIMRTQCLDNSDNTQRALIIGTGKRARNLTDYILDRPELQCSILGFLDFNRTNLWRYRDIPLIGHPDKLRDIISANQIDLLLVAVAPEDVASLRPVIATAEKMGVTVAFLPQMFRFDGFAPRCQRFGDQSTVIYRTTSDSRFRLFGKWVVDKIGAVAGIVLFAPIALITALAIKCDSRGPVLFRQQRSGQNGKLFDLYKFRTMCCDAEDMKRKLEQLNEMSGPVFKISDDPRVTRVGKFIRKYSIDELPQFLNVLRGDMSLVGPRPPLPSEVLQYKSWQHRRLSVKPGITCSWQVSGRNNIDFEDWMRLDLDYIDNWSLRKDASLLMRTIPAVLKCDGAS